MEPYNPTSKPSKPQFFSRRLNLYSLIALLCIVSYVAGGSQQGAWLTTTNPTTTTIAAALGRPCYLKPANTLNFHSLHNASLPTSGKPPKLYPRCGGEYSEYTPCEDRERSLKYSRSRMIYRERHCPEKKESLKCRVPAPFGYKIPFEWPESREVAWYANVPHRELTVEKAVQNWIRYEGDRFRFPGGGTMFPNGADAY